MPRPSGKPAVVAVPSSHPLEFNRDEQMTYVDSVYRSSSYFQGAMVEERSKMWYHRKATQRVLVAGEYGMTPMAGETKWLDRPRSPFIKQASMKGMIRPQGGP